MLKLLKSAGVGAFVFAAIYLLGAFGAADFNIANWQTDSRYLAAFVGGIFGFAAMLFAFTEMFRD
jgi:hypothetical protein